MRLDNAFRSTVRTATFAALMVVASSTLAAVTWFSSEASFNAATDNNASFNFAGIAPANSYLLGAATVGGVTFDSAGQPFVIDGALHYGSPFFSGQTALDLVTATLSGTNAMGFEYGSYFNSALPFTVTLSTGDSINLTTSVTLEDLDFFGFVSTAPVTSVKFTTSVLSSNLDFTRFVLADPAAVPEPATLTLFGVGLAGLGAVRRRRTVN